MADPGPNVEAALADFMTRYFEDLVQGGPKPLPEYLALFPGYEDAIAARYRVLDDSMASSREQPEPGRGAADDLTIGPYRVLRELGRGGQGAVYLAEHRDLGRRVALKVLSVQGAISEAARLRFRREIEVTSRLDHPSICSVYEAGESGGTSWVAMRFVEGETLAQRLGTAREAAGADPADDAFVVDTDGRPPEPGSASGTSTKSGPTTRAEILDTVRLFESVARALHVAHEAGIIHRDIKPGNIMIDREGGPVILDFGLARDLEGGQATLTLTGDLLGTPAYLSPEQLTRQAVHLDRRTDVYSLGVTLYECLTLRRPFEGVSRQAMYQAILAKEPPDPTRRNRAIPRDLKVILETALDKDRDRRYQTALDLAEDLRRFRAHEPIRARPAGPLARFWRWAQRNPAVAALSSGLVLTLVGGLATSLLLWRRAEDSATEAQANLASASLLIDLRRLRWLLKSGDALWPPSPSLCNQLSKWLEDANALEPRFRERRAHWESMSRDWVGSPSNDDEDWIREFVDDGIRVFESDAYAAPSRASIMKRLEKSQAVRDTLEDCRKRWKEALEEIRDPEKCLAYRGLEIKPQVGLIPVGRDPETKLWEFAHLLSGQPVRRMATGELITGRDSGLVLVLLPGGTFKMGAGEPDVPQPGDGLDPPRNAEGPSHEVPLDPFFISKYEMTQGQMQDLVGRNPSEFHEFADWHEHPVERVSWTEAVRALQMLGLILPTEAQWEYAARGGSTTPWWTGKNRASLEGAANLMDESAHRAGRPWGEPEDWNDRHVFHAPVTTLRPNAFGLHHVCGNVWEWCLDTYDWYSKAPARPSDGLRDKATGHLRAIRGGAFNLSAWYARSSWRDGFDSVSRFDSGGIRPARRLDP